MLDLDGVVYIGSDPVVHAAEAVESARAAGMRIAFITNNASRPPESVAKRITATGVPAGADDVVTSAQAAAHLLRDTHGEGAQVLVLGARGLEEALKEAGLVPVSDVEAEVSSLVTGYGPDVVWRDIMRAASRVRQGLPWVATNTDLTLPTPYGVAPGHGVLVGMLRSFTGKEPVVAGKPARPLLDETITRTAAERPLMVGDRLDTDIEGANNAGIPSLLVLTGVTDLAELVAAPAALRPTYISADLRGLLRGHVAPERVGEEWVAGGWRARVDSGALKVTGSGFADDWWLVVAAAGWQALDSTGESADTTHLTPPVGPVPAG